MNTNPKRMDIKMRKSAIMCMVMKARENILNNEATKVVTSGELEVTNMQMPNIDTKSGVNQVSSEGYRVSVDGQEHRVNIDEERRKMQLAIMREQKENNKHLSEDDIDR